MIKIAGKEKNEHTEGGSAVKIPRNGPMLFPVQLAPGMRGICNFTTLEQPTRVAQPSCLDNARQVSITWKST